MSQLKYWNGTTWVAVSIGPRGPQGEIGPAGATGPAGPVGPVGPTGATGITWRGTWSNTVDYTNNDAVYYNNSSWFASGNPPVGDIPSQSSSFWFPLALQGATGATGPAGATGATGPAGAQGPAGPQGATGPAGATGASGLTWRGTWSASTDYAQNDGVFYGGSSWFASGNPAVGDVPVFDSTVWTPLAIQGATGPAGPAGPANSLSVGTVTTGASGSSASVSITGTSPSQILNLTLPRGDVGPQGPQGATGASGLTWRGNWSSATTYVANDAVFHNGTSWFAVSGSTNETPASGSTFWSPLALQGAAGPTGATGPAGPANTLAIGTVTTGNAGTNAAATITGTAPNQTLNLTIPRGNSGATVSQRMFARGLATSVSVPNTTDFVLRTDTAVENIDSGSFTYNAVTGRYTKITTGTVTITVVAGVTYQPTTNTGWRVLFIRKNGNTRVGQVVLPAPGNTQQAFQMQCSSVFTMAQNDYFDIFAYHTAGASLNVAPNNAYPYGHDVRVTWVE